MKTMILLLALLAQLAGQALISPPANWNPAYNHGVPGALKYSPDGTYPWVLAIAWTPAIGNHFGIPDPRWAPVTDVLLGLDQGPIWDPTGWHPTPYGLAITLTPLMWFQVPGSRFQAGTGGVEASLNLGPVPPIMGLEWSLQALIVHRFGAPDVAYLSAPVPIWL